MRNRNIKTNQNITRRTFVIGAGKLGLLFILSCRMFYMQFIKKDEYKTLSDKNRIKIIPLTPKRGTILDRNNNIVAQNKICFNLMLDKSTKYSYKSEIETIINILDLDQEQVQEITKRVARGGYRIPVLIINQMEWSQVASIEEGKANLKSSFIETGFERYYPEGEAVAHLIGYMGKSSSKEKHVYDNNFKVGKNGVERQHENILQGEFGYKKTEVNSRGRHVREIEKKSSVTGNKLKLNIDLELQKKSLEYLDERGCSAVVMDCTNGDVVLYSSAPGYNPNEFNKLSNKYWRELINNPYNPLIDKITKSPYPPGSVFKIVTVLAALEYGIDPKQKINCTGKPMLGGRYFRCWRHSGHGPINMTDALKKSCNSYMYWIARKVGAENISNMAKKLGFGDISGIDLPGEVKGINPSPEWKYKRYKRKWTIGDTLNMAIGQGYNLCTPLQITRMMAVIASKGKLFTPSLASGQKNSYINAEIQQEHLQIISEALFQVVNEPGGTGYANRIWQPNMLLAGKTSTAQVRSKKNAKDNLSRADVAWASRNHAAFSGFAPYHDPKYAITVYYDHGGGGGSSAMPIAKKIMLDIMQKYS